MNRRESEDARFHELMAREFPGGLAAAETTRRPSDRPPAAPAPESEPEPSGLLEDPPDPSPAGDTLPTDFRSWTPPEEPEEEFVPPPAPPARRWSPAGIAGTALVILPVLMIVASALGVRFPMLVSVLTGLGFLVGVWLLLHRLRQRPPIDGDGAVV